MKFLATFHASDFICYQRWDENMRCKKIIYINIYDTSCLQHATDYKENRKKIVKIMFPN